MAYTIGTDIQGVSRFNSFARSLSSINILKSFFSKNEIENAKNSRYSARVLASRFCVKEAFLKATGTGFSGNFEMKDIEITNNSAGKPYLTCHGVAVKFYEAIKSIDVSISHFGEYVSSVVICEFYEADAR